MSRLDGELWLITTYFNPVKYKNKREIFIKFYNRIKEQGAKLVIVELAGSLEDCELKDLIRPDDIYEPFIASPTDNIWQKEKLLNYGLSKLPSTSVCDKVMWIDCDILIKDNDWIQKTNKLLDKYAVVQPMEFCVKLSNKNIIPKNITDLSFEHEYKNRAILNNAWIAAYLKFGRISLDGRAPQTWGHPGFCCAFQRSIIDDIGFFSHRPDCSNDSLMSFAIIGNYHEKENILRSGVGDLYDKWGQTIFERTMNSMGYIEGGVVYHIYHGSFDNRKYEEQNSVVAKLGYYYSRDIISYNNKEHLMEWSEFAPTKLRIYFNNYFGARKENE